MKATLNKNIEHKDYYSFEKGEEFTVKNNNQKVLILVEDFLGFQYWLKREDFDL